MIQLTSIIQHLNKLLHIDKYRDAALNGLQFESGAVDVQRVAVAVDAGLSVIEEAIHQRADLLIVHHGLFWGTQLPITGALAKKIRLLSDAKCSLYAAHLPLDGNLEVGNAAEICRCLDLKSIEEFCSYQGATIGARGTLAKKISREELISLVSEVTGTTNPLVLPFGVSDIKNIGIVTGSGSSAIVLCPESKIDCLVTGEPKQEAFHLAQELGVNVIFAGHYATETFGVKALSAHLKKVYDLPELFIDIPTGI